MVFTSQDIYIDWKEFIVNNNLVIAIDSCGEHQAAFVKLSIVAVLVAMFKNRLLTNSSAFLRFL